MGTKTINSTYYHDQATAAMTWTINHNLATVSPCVDFWVLDGAVYTKVLPLAVTVISGNTVQATFTTAQAGRASVV